MQPRRSQAGKASPEALFGATLRAVRTERGLSQEALAEASGYHRVFIGYLEQGRRNPTLRTILDLASVLDVLPSELLARFENDLPKPSPGRAPSRRGRAASSRAT